MASWLQWIRHLTTDQEILGSSPGEVVQIRAAWSKVCYYSCLELGLMMESSLTTPYHRIAFPLLAFYDLTWARRALRQVINSNPTFDVSIFVKGAQNVQFSCRIFLKISETLKAHISGTETDINKW